MIKTGVENDENKVRVYEVDVIRCETDVRILMYDILKSTIRNKKGFYGRWWSTDSFLINL